MQSSPRLTLVTLLLALGPALGFGEATATPEAPDTPIYLQTFQHIEEPRRTLQIQSLMADGGFGGYRNELPWNSVERTTGTFVFPAHDFFTSSVALGLRPLFLLDYGNDNYEIRKAPATPPYRAAFRRYAEAMVSRYGHAVTEWEVWNEPDLLWLPHPDPKQYTALLKEVYPAIKAAQPTATVAGVGIVQERLEFLEAVLAAGGGPYFDVMSLHPYRYPVMPEESPTIADEIQEAADILARHDGVTTRIWVTELGCTTKLGYAGVSELRQAELAVRSCLLSLTVPEVERVYWFELVDHQPGTEQKNSDSIIINQQFGIVRHDLSPKPAYRALSTLARALKGKKFIRQLTPEGSPDFALLFGSASDGYLTAAWSPGRDGQFCVEASSGSLTLVDVFDSAPLSASRSVSFRTGTMPRFVHSMEEPARAAFCDPPLTLDKPTLCLGTTVTRSLAGTLPPGPERSITGHGGVHAEFAADGEILIRPDTHGPPFVAPTLYFTRAADIIEVPLQIVPRLAVSVRIAREESGAAKFYMTVANRGDAPVRRAVAVDLNSQSLGTTKTLGSRDINLAVGEQTAFEFPVSAPLRRDELLWYEVRGTDAEDAMEIYDYSSITPVNVARGPMTVDGAPDDWTTAPPDLLIGLRRGKDQFCYPDAKQPFPLSQPFMGNAAALIDHAYQQLQGRRPAPQESEWYASRFSSGELTTGTFILAMAASPEFRRNAGFIVRAYLSLLNRTDDWHDLRHRRIPAAELGYHLNAIASGGGSPRSVAAAMLSSDEFTSITGRQIGDFTRREFLSYAAARICGRSMSETDLDQLLADAPDADHAQLAVMLLQSPDALARFEKHELVTATGIALHGYDEVPAWVFAWYMDRLTGRLQPPISPGDVVQAMMCSTASPTAAPCPHKIANYPDVTSSTARALVWLRHDDQCLHLSLQARDAEHFQEAPAEELWQHDSIQIAIDTDRENGSRIGTFEFGVAGHLADGIMRPLVHCWRSPAGADRDASQIKAAIRRAPQGTFYEVSIPWTTLAMPPPQPGSRLGLSILLNDSNHPGHRDYYEWYTGIVARKDTRQFGVVTIGEPD